MVKRKLPFKNRSVGSGGVSSRDGSTRTPFINEGSSRREYGDSTSLPGSGTDSILETLSGDSSYISQLLGAIGAAGGADTSYLQLLLQIAAANKDKPGTIDDDLQNKLLQMVLDSMVKNEQRSYDESALKEQRLYDSPSNQLARLMGAGVSRDAAFQLLQGGSESPLVGSGAESASQDTGHPFTNQAFQAVNSSLSFISSVGSLVSLGFTLPQAIQQTHFLKNQNLLTDRQLKDFDS